MPVARASRGGARKIVGVKDARRQVVAAIVAVAEIGVVAVVEKIVMARAIGRVVSQLSKQTQN